MIFWGNRTFCQTGFQVRSASDFKISSHISVIYRSVLLFFFKKLEFELFSTKIENIRSDFKLATVIFNLFTL